jgi:arylsulfatase A-like enzyme
MSTSGKSNVVFILADDLAVWATGCYGNAEIRTPNHDRMAATGMRFENFSVTIPVCSASRASLLTGRIPSQHGVHDFVGGHANFGDQGLSFLDDEVCYTNVLADNGWSCGISGKWHLGNSSLPQCGFSHWFVQPGGAGSYNDHSMIRDGVTEVVPGYVTNVITDDALDYIDAHARR